MTRRSSRTIYVGNLPGDIRMREVEDIFYKFGPIVDIDLKIPPKPPGYAFVEFEDARDAEDAIYYRDGYEFDGFRLRVELAHGGRGHSSSIDRYSSYSGSSGNRGVSKRSDYRVLVTGLPPSASWQDLKGLGGSERSKRCKQIDSTVQGKTDSAQWRLTGASCARRQHGAGQWRLMRQKAEWCSKLAPQWRPVRHLCAS